MSNDPFWDAIYNHKAFKRRQEVAPPANPADVVRGTGLCQYGIDAYSARQEILAERKATLYGPMGPDPVGYLAAKCSAMGSGNRGIL